MAYQPSWSQKVAASIHDKIDASPLSLNMIAKITGIPLTTLFRRYQGVNAWDTQQIEAVAEALGTDPYALMPPQRGRKKAS
jgi:hypothetical protein